MSETARVITLGPDELILRAQSYRDTFDGAKRAARVVLVDLARFCHAQATTHVIGDAAASAQLEGRRQVWLRLTEYRHINDAELYAMRREFARREEG